jgi:hypothetical protein
MNEKLKKILLAKDFTDDEVAKIDKALGDKKIMLDDDNFIPLSRLTAKNKEIEKLNDIINKNSEDYKSLKTALENDDTKDKFAKIEIERDKLVAELNKQKIDNKFISDFSTLRTAKQKAVRGLVDWTKVKNIDGEIVGYDSQIKEIRENEENAFIFAEDTAGKGEGEGNTGGEGNFGKGDNKKSSTSSFFDTVKSNQAKRT